MKTFLVLLKVASDAPPTVYHAEFFNAVPGAERGAAHEKFGLNDGRDIVVILPVEEALMVAEAMRRWCQTMHMVQVLSTLSEELKAEKN